MNKAAAAGLSVCGAAAGAPPLWKRLVSTLVLAPLFVWVVTSAPPWAFQLLVVLVSAVSAWELARMLAWAGQPVCRRLGVIAAAAVTASFAAPGAVAAPAIVLALVVGVVLAVPVLSGTPPSIAATANTLLVVAWIGWLLGFGVSLHASPNGEGLVLFLVAVTWTGESAAYLVGSAVGRHQLAPLVSPRKTVEGAVAQALASVGAGALLGLWLMPGCGLLVPLAGGAILGVVGQLGDLAESVVKRSVGAKDTSGLIPGHGGLLDRIDSLLFNAPALYLYALAAGCGG